MIDDALRQAVEATAREVRLLLTGKKLPPPVDDARRCPECSLRDICQPELARADKKLVALRADLFEPEDESL
jgi:CRISPR-associated exonuclease Cas4